MKKLIVGCVQLADLSGLLLMTDVAAVAQDKVVVIPLNSRSTIIPNNTSPCTPAIAGTIRCTGENFEGCDGSYWGRLSLTANVPTVFSAGQEWMDRNLGASRVATSMTDQQAYGDLYQWGRDTDGHEKRNSGITSTLSGSNSPGHGNFITTSSWPYDWRSPQNINLWQGVSGVNNPCPSGFRLPTAAEWEGELASWGGNNNPTGALNSPLKLVPAGIRDRSNGTLYDAGSVGDYCSATVNGSNSRDLYFESGDANVYSINRAYGSSVRCLKD